MIRGQFRSLSRWLWHGACLITIAACNLQAQSPEPVELESLRKKHTLRAITSATRLTEQFTKALLQIEQESGLNGDYETALKARQRRIDLTNIYTRVQHENALNSQLLLPASTARLSGSVSYSRTHDTLIDWKTNSTATWDVPKITPGMYAVTVTYAVAPIGDISERSISHDSILTGGEVEFYEDSSLTSARQNRRTLKISNTGSWTTFSTQQLTAMNITRPSTRFSLKVLRTNGGGGLMHLQSIRLVPITPLVTAEAEKTNDLLEAEHLLHGQNIKSLTSPIAEKYIIDLQTALNEAESKGSEELSEHLRRELKRVSNWKNDPQFGMRIRNLTASALSNSEDWKDARYVSAATNRGDRFTITNKGIHTSVRLMGIACPPVSADDLAELQYFAAYFNITSEDALALGVKARDFTTAYLADHELHLKTDGTRDRQGNLIVSIHPEHLGDFTGILVDNGLAAIVEPNRSRPGGADMAETLTYLALKEREQTTRLRIPPPGGWALSSEK